MIYCEKWGQNSWALHRCKNWPKNNGLLSKADFSIFGRSPSGDNICIGNICTIVAQAIGRPNYPPLLFGLCGGQDRQHKLLHPHI